MPRPSFIAILYKSAPFRVLQVIVGVLAMLLAPLVGVSTPGPFGIFVFAFGLALLLRNSVWARRRYVRYTWRYPRVRKAVNFGLRRKRVPRKR